MTGMVRGEKSMRRWGKRLGPWTVNLLSVLGGLSLLAGVLYAGYVILQNWVIQQDQFVALNGIAPLPVPTLAPTATPAFTPTPVPTPPPTQAGTNQYPGHPGRVVHCFGAAGNRSNNRLDAVGC